MEHTPIDIMRFPKHCIENNSLQEKLNVAKMFLDLFRGAEDGTPGLSIWQVFALSTKLNCLPLTIKWIKPQL